MKDLFLDIEALGRRPGCAIIQLAAVVFDPATGETADEFEAYIQPEEGDPWHVELATLEWHREQGTFPHAPEILEAAFAAGDAIDAFTDWIIDVRDRHPIEDVWSWGSTYDFPMLDPYWDRYAMGGQAPWNYWNPSDARGFWKLAFPGIKHGPRPHHALEDCRHGIKDLVSALRELTAGRDIVRELARWSLAHGEAVDILPAEHGRKLWPIIAKAREFAPEETEVPA
jgi:hypothetical protein